MCVCPYGTFLSLNSSYRINLDVFLIDAEDDLYGFTESTKNCSFFQFFHCPEELFVSFSSILIRLFINCVMNVFNFLKVSLADEKKILFLMVKHAKIFLDKFWYTTNHKFFMIFLISLRISIAVPVLRNRLELNIIVNDLVTFNASSSCQ